MLTYEECRQLYLEGKLIEGSRYYAELRSELGPPPPGPVWFFNGNQYECYATLEEAERARQAYIVETKPQPAPDNLVHLPERQPKELSKPDRKDRATIHAF